MRQRRLYVTFLATLLLLLLSNPLFGYEAQQNDINDTTAFIDDQHIDADNSKASAYLQKLDAQNTDLSAIFNVDLRHDENFLKALDSSIQFYSTILGTEETFRYGEENYTPLQMLHSLIMFRKIVTKEQPYQNFLLELKENFDVYLAKNNGGYSKLTGYYTPEIQASEVKNETYSYPLYLTKTKLDVGKPDFYVQSRDDIRRLEMEGAGILDLDDGKSLNLQYTGRKNILREILAHKKELIKTKKIVRRHGKKHVVVAKVVKTVPVQIAKKDSKAVFEIADGGPYGAISKPLVPGYSAAMDMNITPAGSLVYVKTNDEKQAQDDTSTGSIIDRAKKGFESFMLVHDTGGAIKGAGRVDIYCGEGKKAARCTFDVTSKIGSVYLLVAKKEALRDLIRQ